MTLGEKIKATRLEAGLSQRQLCGEVITRNMLSQIENGSASPSMSTLQYLAGRLGKSVSYFLQEQVIDSPNPALMQRARQHYDLGQYPEVLALLEQYRSPDPLFDQEQQYLYALCALAQGEKCAKNQDAITVAAMLEKISRDCIYYRKDMEQTRRQLLLWAYPVLEEQYRQQKNFEKAYEYACKLRQLQH